MAIVGQLAGVQIAWEMPERCIGCYWRVEGSLLCESCARCAKCRLYCRCKEE